VKRQEMDKDKCIAGLKKSLHKEKAEVRRLLQLEDAEWRGYNASLDGESREANPHKFMSDTHDSWDLGWVEEDERQKEWKKLNALTIVFACYLKLNKIQG